MNYFFKILTFWWSFRAFLERKVFIKNIGKNDLVLDIGSGDKPFWRADIIVDKYIKDNQQRHSGSILFDQKKIFIEADVENLPFKDKVFDFVFCSHLLEHVKNPDKAISELTRVAKSGYIEVPNAILDLFKPFESHLWFCDCIDNVLIFHQKEKDKTFFINNTEKFGAIFNNSQIMQYLLARSYKSVFISLYWKDNIKYKIIKAKNKDNIYEYKERKIVNKNLYLRAIFIFYKIFYKALVFLFYKKKNFNVKNLLTS